MTTATRARLVFFFGRNSGRSRRVEGHLSQEAPRGCRDIERLLAPWLR